MGLDFSHYSNSTRAEAVYREYEPDITRLGLQERAEFITLSCRDHKGLDIALDRLISGSKSHKTRGKNRSFY